MRPDQAKFLLEYCLPQLRDESAITRKVIAAIPEEKREYRPDPISRSAMEIAWHIVSSEIWFFDGLITGQFGTEEEKMPAQIKTVADILAWYDKSVPGLIEKLNTLSDEQLTRTISFFGLFNYPAVAYLSFLFAHSIHHRGQLVAYLRPMGAKVPSIYGGSADEPFQMPAEQPGS